MRLVVNKDTSGSDIVAISLTMESKSSSTVDFFTTSYLILCLFGETDIMEQPAMSSFSMMPFLIVSVTVAVAASIGVPEVM